MSFAVGKVVFRSPFTKQDPGEVARKTEENRIISTLRTTVEFQRQTIVMLERKMADVSAQNEELRKSITITPQQQAAFVVQSQNALEMQGQLDQLALWLRENKSVEIAQGKHNGRSLIDVILGYLGGTLPAALPPATEGKAN